ncbi:hypothetical protein ACFPRL_10735 [Pseudoclavibacter helvolus]
MHPHEHVREAHEANPGCEREQRAEPEADERDDVEGVKRAVGHKEPTGCEKRVRSVHLRSPPAW